MPSSAAAARILQTSLRIWWTSRSVVGRRYASFGLRPTRLRTLWMAWYPQVRDCCGLGGLGWVGSRPHPDLRDHGRRPSLRVTTGPVGARLSGLKAYRTDDRPRTPRWHTREGDAAVPVCMGRARCRWVWGVDWLGCEARRVTRQCRAWPGPGPVSHAGGGPWAGLNPLLWALGGGGALTYLCLPYTGTTRGRHGVSAARH